MLARNLSFHGGLQRKMRSITGIKEKPSMAKWETLEQACGLLISSESHSTASSPHVAGTGSLLEVAIGLAWPEAPFWVDPAALVSGASDH